MSEYVAIGNNVLVIGIYASCTHNFEENDPTILYNKV